MLEIINKSISSDGSIKYAFKNQEGNLFESIYFRLPPNNGIAFEEYRICVSSQAGCAMGCKFCATGHGGFFANLTPEEILEQVDLIVKDIVKNEIEKDDAAFNIALMGMGEPLKNYNNICTFLGVVQEKFPYLNRMSLSTVGISNRIYELANLSLDIRLKLYLSVHSPYNAERTKIMPITQKYSIESAIEACKEYAKKTNGYVKATYLLLKGINDTQQHAIDFANLLDPRYFEAQIQLYNPTIGLPYQRVSDEFAYEFKNIVAKKGLDTILQISRGRDVEGGCGQLIKKNRKNIKLNTDSQ